MQTREIYYSGDQQVALENEIIRTLAGSEVVGMALGGQEDRDEIGVYIETPEQLLGLTPTAGSYVARTQPDGVRSGAGDVDLNMYSLRKYMQLAVAGNPSILTLLFAPESAIINCTPLGHELRALTPSILSKNAGYRHLGYLDGQRERMIGLGKQRRVPNRPELIEKYGYDTKYASHALRLGMQGIELVTSGKLTLPMPSESLDMCMRVKCGEVSFDIALDWVDRTRAVLSSVIKTSDVLPDSPDRDQINGWMRRATQNHWWWKNQ